jgi:DNA polymerase I-like protein with 3'-5' exonuclease and polymerase domains/5'-3' exonuclease
MTETKKERLVVIDAHALIHRAYHALPPLTSPQGVQVHAVYGFTSVLIKMLRELKPTHVVAAFDLPGKTFRHEEFLEYKAHRPEADRELVEQFPFVRQVVSAFGITVLEKEGYEADDIIGTVARSAHAPDREIVIVTGDLDTLQLVRDREVLVYTMKRGVTETVIYDEEKVRERYGGLTPAQLSDFRGLKGDPSDNIPGVPGIGEKTAIQLLGTYTSLERLYERLPEAADISDRIKEKLVAFRDQAFFSKKLAEIHCQVPITFSLNQAKFTFSTGPELEKILVGLGFDSLVTRLKKDTTAAPPAPPTLFEVPEISEGRETPALLSEYRKKGVFSQKIEKLEVALFPVLRRMEKEGIAIDLKILKQLNQKLTDRLVALEKEAFALAGTSFNLNSPQEVAAVLFEKIGLSQAKQKRTRTGLISTRATELEKLRGAHPLVPLLLEWRELSKLKSTYLETFPRLIGKDGRMHTTYNQVGTATGRLSSDSPNLQNIPIRGRYGKDIRQAFVPRSGYVIVSADYSQLELRIAAALSKDPKMLAAFKKGEDIHTRTAAEIFNVGLSEVTKEMRRTAKVLNFGVLYGMGPRAFSQGAKVPPARAREFIDEYRADFSRLTEYLEESKREARQKGYAETVWGRRRHLEDIRSPHPGLRAAAERMASNMPIQGTEADIIKAAMVEIDRAFSTSDDVYMLLQVHDELVFEVRKAAMADVLPKIKKIMENVIEFEVPLEMDVSTGPSWGDLEPVNPKS